MKKSEVMKLIKEYLETEDLCVHFYDSTDKENEMTMHVRGEGMGLDGDEDFEQGVIEQIFVILDNWIPKDAKVESSASDGAWLTLAVNFTTDGSEPISYSPPHGEVKLKKRRSELKKIRIEYESEDGIKTTGECWIPKDGENPMASIITQLELLTEDSVVDVTDIEE